MPERTLEEIAETLYVWGGSATQDAVREMVREAHALGAASRASPDEGPVCGDCAHFVAESEGRGLCAPGGEALGYVDPHEEVCSNPGPLRSAPPEADPGPRAEENTSDGPSRVDRPRCATIRANGGCEGVACPDCPAYLPAPSSEGGRHE